MRTAGQRHSLSSPRDIASQPGSTSPPGKRIFRWFQQTQDATAAAAADRQGSPKPARLAAVFKAKSAAEGTSTKSSSASCSQKGAENLVECLAGEALDSGVASSTGNQKPVRPSAGPAQRGETDAVDPPWFSLSLEFGPRRTTYTRDIASADRALRSGQLPKVLRPTASFDNSRASEHQSSEQHQGVLMSPDLFVRRLEKNPKDAADWDDDDYDFVAAALLRTQLKRMVV